MGSKILPGYEVHHINGVKTDNRPSNLIVLSKAKHRAIHSKGVKKWNFKTILKTKEVTLY